MSNDASTKFPYLVIAAGLAVVGGALSLLLARKESREFIRERGVKGLEYLNRASAKLNESTDGLVEKGRAVLSGYCGTTDTAGESATPSEQGDKPEMH